jgi:DNA-binding transcriptional LysR family regulator
MLGTPPSWERQMLLEQLRDFLAVAAAGSFSRAAILSGATQSAISKRVLALERDLGATLFERTGRGARMTEAGRALWPRADILVKEADALSDVVAADSSRPRGIVRVAIQPSAAWPLLRDLYVGVRDAYPSIHLQVAEAPTAQIAEWLRDGRHDLGVLSQAAHKALPDAQLLFASSLQLVSRAGDPLTRRSTIAFDRIAKLPLVVAVMPNGGRVLLEEVARQRGVRLNVAMDVYSIHLIKNLVREGLAYTIALASAIADEIETGQLAAARIAQPSITQAFYLSTSPARRPSAAVRAVAEMIRTLTHAPARAMATSVARHAALRRSELSTSETRRPPSDR